MSLEIFRPAKSHYILVCFSLFIKGVVMPKDSSKLVLKGT